MKRMIRFFTLLLCAAAALMPVVRAEEMPAPVQPRQLIRQLVTSYAGSGKRDAEALSGLYALDPSLGDKWERILDLWETPAALSEALPDGLPDDDTLCLVVLGYRLNPDGTMRDELIERLKVALAAAEKYPRALIACTGGPTAMNDPATEAGRMTEWLKAQGVDPARLIAEERSLTTVQNAVYTIAILKESYPQVRQIAVISSDYHVPTGVLLFGAEAILRDSGITVAGSAAWDAPTGTVSPASQAIVLLLLSAE